MLKGTRMIVQSASYVYSSICLAKSLYALDAVFVMRHASISMPPSLLTLPKGTEMSRVHFDRQRLV